MKYNKLGNTDLEVSKLCFGSLTISPLQAKLSIEEGSRLIRAAYDYGVNFIDTAELYKNYDYIRAAVKGIRGNMIISTKCYAYDREGAEKSLHKALKELDTDYIDVFSLHEQESELTIKGHYEAIEYFIKAKEKGIIRSFGISTHAINAVRAALKYNEIEVIHPIVNLKGLGIIDGDINEMLKSIKEAKAAGKGIYSMKPLGGGNLINNSKEAFDFVLSNPDIHSIAVGMQSYSEIVNNVLIFENKAVPDNITAELKKKNRRLLIDFWCTGCGSCANVCKQKAISIIEGRAVVDKDKCVLCGYCSAYCKEFCIKVI